MILSTYINYKLGFGGGGGEGDGEVVVQTTSTPVSTHPLSLRPSRPTATKSRTG